jgi:hypothetical protein
MASASANNQQITNRTLRQIGWIVAIGLAAGGQLLDPNPSALWLKLAGAAVFAIATVRASALRPIYSGVMWVCRPLLTAAAYLVRMVQERRPPVSPRGRGQIANTGT